MKLLFLVSTALLFVTGCQTLNTSQSSAKQDQGLLFQVADIPVYTDEFTYVYKKNNFNNDSAFLKSDIEAYLDLFINFKLKIKEAMALGIDTSASFITEYDTYKDQLKKPYLSDKAFNDRFVREAYERYKKEINAAHILIRLGKEPSPEDTLQAYEKVMEIRNKAISGDDFDHLAKTYSEDPTAKSNGGDLGYFTSMQMVYPFESAAYLTPKGEISKPVRTQFGYHIIKVRDVRPATGKVEVAHIMVRTTPSMTAKDSTMVKNRIFDIYDQLAGGMDWGELCEQFSEDPSSRDKEGRLPAFGIGRMPIDFQEVAFSLENKGDISDPFTTPYGWHIVRLEERIPLESFESMEPSIRSRISRDARATLGKKALIKKLKEENGFVVVESVKTRCFALADSTLTAGSGSWQYPDSLQWLAEDLFNIGDKPYPARQFLEHTKKNRKPATYAPARFMELLFERYVEEQLLTYEEEHLEEKYPEYRMLLKEYREGIMLFQLMEEKVWNKAIRDSVGLENFFASHRESYQWKQRVDARIFSAASPEIIKEIKEAIGRNDSLELTKKVLEAKYNKESTLNLQIEEGLFEKENNPQVDKVPWEKGLYERNEGDRYMLVQVRQTVSPGFKKLEEVKGLVISDYQDHLEKQWLKELKVKYPVEIQDRSLNRVLNELEKNRT